MSATLSVIGIFMGMCLQMISMKFPDVRVVGACILISDTFCMLPWQVLCKLLN